MTALAAAEDSRFEALDLEVSRIGPSYSVDTLEQLSTAHPEAELHFIMGADAAAGLGDWRQPERVVELARPAIARREGVALAEVLAVMRRLGVADRVNILEMPSFGVSSSLVRERAAAEMPLRYLVPDAVAELISDKRIYGGADGGIS